MQLHYFDLGKHIVLIMQKLPPEVFYKKVSIYYIIIIIIIKAYLSLARFCALIDVGPTPYSQLSYSECLMQYSWQHYFECPTLYNRLCIVALKQPEWGTDTKSSCFKLRIAVINF